MSVTDPVLQAGAVEFDPFSDDFFNHLRKRLLAG